MRPPTIGILPIVQAISVHSDLGRLPLQQRRLRPRRVTYNGTTLGVERDKDASLRPVDSRVVNTGPELVGDILRRLRR